MPNIKIDVSLDLYTIDIDITYGVLIYFPIKQNERLKLFG